MSNTKKKKYNNHNVKGRKNEYGLCQCSECRANRKKKRNNGLVVKAKHKSRTNWKTGKSKLLKGIFTD